MAKQHGSDPRIIMWQEPKVKRRNKTKQDKTKRQAAKQYGFMLELSLQQKPKVKKRDKTKQDKTRG